MTVPHLVRNVELAAVRPVWPSSFGRDSQGLAVSIKSLGLIRPPTVMAEGTAFTLVSGRLRLAALAELGYSAAAAVVLPPETGQAEAFEIALAENAERGWNPAELALIWQFMAVTLPEREALRLATYLALDKTPKIRAWAEAAAGLPKAALTALADGGLDLESAARLAAWTPEGLAAILHIFETLAPSKQKKRQWLDWLEDAGRREKVSPAAILKAPEITMALAEAGRGGKSAAEEAARHALWRRRHPRLAQLTERRREQIKALALPKNLRLEVDPTFEDLKFNLNLTFTSPEELMALARKVSALSDDPSMLALLREGSE